MTDDIDRAQAREAELLADALHSQHRRAGLTGKTMADSAEHCQARGCAEPIPEPRRRALPGVRLCVACQARLEKTSKGKKAQ
ncbi:TraR/DksA C4-type zinc finger protein [Comamonas flocculans]|uniref:TraR/DksA C4-type zinc finger protein n=1 Tax=Comamonas flocculans TaxID=2597701 RepID=UPI0016461ACB|nr:TraR/DksA C4-type zinc finger protein [Comamonas flocculans]